MRAPQGLGESKPRCEPCAAEPPHQIGKKRAFAAEEMGHAADIEPEPIGAINIQRGAIAAGRPAGEIAKGVLILLGLRREDADRCAGSARRTGGGSLLAPLRGRGIKVPLFVADQQRPVNG
jgi:hypothetical protein